MAVGIVRWRRLGRGPIGVSIALLGACVAAYGLLVPRLGFYWDDWPNVWFLHVLGSLGFWSAFAVDRPILPWLYMLTTPLAGADPARWHILGILAHTLAALGLWWALRSLWPEHPAQATWVALSFAVYPGFLQSPISIIYTHFFLLFALFAVSLVGMILSVRLPRCLLLLSLVFLLG
jgi:hypothetical protein